MKSITHVSLPVTTDGAKFRNCTSTRLALARVCTRSVLAKYKDTVFIFDISISSLAICYARYANHYTDIFIQCKHYLHLQCDLSPTECEADSDDTFCSQLQGSNLHMLC
ncbi:hypothetical protein [Escherichia phage dw-ec]|nr:hypothetical protein [Escherichia phage dw-ec]